MFRRLLLVALGFLPLAALALPAEAQVALKKKEDPTYIVVEVDEQSMYVLISDQFDAARAQLETAYRQELERYKLAKKRNPDLKEPERKKIAIVGTGFKDKEAAQEHIAKLIEKRQDNAAKKKPRERDRDK